MSLLAATLIGTDRKTTLLWVGNSESGGWLRAKAFILELPRSIYFTYTEDNFACLDIPRKFYSASLLPSSVPSSPIWPLSHFHPASSVAFTFASVINVISGMPTSACV